MAEGYARPELIAEIQWLETRLGDHSLCIVEMGTTREDFEKGHIPGAILCEDWHLKRASDSPLVLLPEQAKQLFESLGIGDDTLVIPYDRNRNRDASRLWWVLTYYGHANVKVLNGGWVKWRSENRPAETGSGALGAHGMGPSPSTHFTPSERPDVLCTVDTLKAAIGTGEAAIWDTRSYDEYTGKNDRGNKRRGHVPGAKHLEWLQLVNEDHTFKEAAVLRPLLAAAGIVPEKEVHSY